MDDAQIMDSPREVDVIPSISNPATGAKAPIQRHAEIDNRLARKICDQLGIPSIR
jgi:hypothetical protein